MQKTAAQHFVGRFSFSKALLLYPMKYLQNLSYPFSRSSYA